MSKATGWVLFLALAAAAAGGAYWWTARPPLVELAQPQRGPAVEAVYATGEVEPRRLAEISALVIGRIATYPVEERDKVEAGQLLVQLDDTTVRAVLDEWTAEVDYLEKDAARYRQLLRKDTVSRQTYDRIVSELAKARAHVSAAAQRVEDMAIRAPFGGVVIRKEREIGEVLDSGDTLLWIGAERPYRIEAQVDEEDLPRVTVGQKALITSDAFVGQVFEGQVAEITPKGDPVNKQYRVRIGLPEDSPLRIGMTTEVNLIVREEAAALLIPEAAVADGHVWLYRDGQAVKRDVELGAYGDRVVEVRGGLSEGDSVILDPPGDLSDGAPVRLTKD